MMETAKPQHTLYHTMIEMYFVNSFKSNKCKKTQIEKYIFMQMFQNKKILYKCNRYNYGFKLLQPTEETFILGNSVTVNWIILSIQIVRCEILLHEFKGRGIIGKVISQQCVLCPWLYYDLSILNLSVYQFGILAGYIMHFQSKHYKSKDDSLEMEI